VFICIIGLQLLPGCEKRPEPLDRKTMRMIDTLATKEIRVLRVELDSLCDLNFDMYVQYYVDSILDVRREEIKKLIE
jgi:hypothetical protein